jgi:hydrogenase nickel incorporation protein HypB
MCESCGCGQPHDHAHDGRVIDVRRDVLSHNAAHAEQNRSRLSSLGITSLNLIGSPGAGKTTLLESAIPRLARSRPVIVVEGDLQTTRDAERIERTGAAVHQINTGDGCHLDAHQVGHALEHLPLAQDAVLIIENVGNLVCPAGFDLGESRRVVVLSTAEGDDKVEKYPIAFKDTHALVISKVDLLEHVEFDVERCRQLARTLNPDIEIFEVSARTGQGVERWCSWVLGAAR